MLHELAVSAYESRDTVGSPAKCAYLKYLLPSFTGVSAKMVVGLHRSTPMDSEAMLNNVSDQLEGLMPMAFSFIGLQTRWNESVCLLHLLRGRYPTVPVEFSNSRPTPKTGIDWEAEAEACGLGEQL